VKREFPAENLALPNVIKFSGKILIINEILVEAAGVELITMLTARKLLILGSATRAKKVPLPDPLYVYCTRIFSRSRCADSRSLGLTLGSPGRVCLRRNRVNHRHSNPELTAQVLLHIMRRLCF
jgi:hypothetical protein